MKIPKDSSVSKELSKKFGRVFNTKETFFFDIGKEVSNVNTMGVHVEKHLQEKADYVNNKGKSNGKTNC
jgi:hypothetical protein|tara:strand:+ start:98 stop:304 length:207 start_codon:yes stop_codon:yes gene_type:complete